MFDEKRIIIYGTGKLSCVFIKNNKYNIVGILDQFRIGGAYLGYPILDWRDINRETCDCIVIAAPRKYIKEIYFRILHKCLGLSIEIYDHYGNDLKIRFGMEYLWREEYKTLKRTKEELKTLIEKHDAISFDIFDTLIMRTTLDPLDVLDYTEEELRENYHIDIKDFYKKHRNADYESKGGNLDAILKIIQENYSLTDDEVHLIKKVEIESEKKHLIVRKDIVELFQFAIDSGKRVNLISDMYLNKDILADILSGLGVTGYEKIYVSCDYGVGKSNGLFDIYKREVISKSYLHVGDNHRADYESAIKAGIDAYEIKSAYELLTLSSISSILQYTKGTDEKSYIAKYIAEKFNSPFSLADSNIVKIDSVDEFVKICILPILLVYIQKLIETVKSNKYKVVALGARDCYLVKKLIDEKNIDLGCNVTYLYCSRRLAWRASLVNEDRLNEFIKFYISEQTNPIPTFKNVFADWVDVDWKLFTVDEILEILENNKNVIFEKSKHIKDLYSKYLQNNGMNGNILFCDLNSQGTTQSALNCILEKSIDGFYLQWVEGCLRRELTKVSLYSEKDYVGEYNELLESIFTSPEQSVWDIDDNGNIQFAKEDRLYDDIEFMNLVHNCIAEYCKDDKYTNYSFSKEFSEKMLSLVANVVFEDEASIVNNIRLRNDLGNEVYMVI